MLDGARCLAAQCHRWRSSAAGRRRPVHQRPKPPPRRRVDGCRADDERRNEAHLLIADTLIWHMALFRRGSVSAGLDIGSGLVKLVRIDHSKREPAIVQLATRPLAPGAIVEREIMDRAAVAEAVRSVAEMAALKRREVVAAVGGHDVIIKKIQMDRMGQADAGEVMKWEAEQHVPFDMESVQLDFQILDPFGQGPEMPVLLVAAKRELIESRLSLLAEAGLSPAMIDVDAFALHNAFERSYPDRLHGFVALVNVGHETTNVALLEHGLPVLMRDVPFGSRRLREALERERGLTSDEADALLQGRANGSRTELRGFVADRAEELAVAIERAATFVTAQSAGRGIGQVFLSGGGARVPALADAVAARLRVPTELANPLERVAIQPDVMQSVSVDELAPLLMLSVGLALRRV